jgi:hypothetical protein
VHARLRGIPTAYADVADFVDAAWPLSAEDPDRWADAFAEAQHRQMAL